MNNSSILSSLFAIQNVEENKGNVQAKVVINKDCEIYKAHFPGNPITPGVCQVHLIKDVLAEAYPNINLSFKYSKQIKFTEILRPSENNIVKVNIDVVFTETDLTATAQIFNLDKIFLKAKLTYSFGA